MAPVRFIHVGYAKCASTTLQADYFSEHPEIYSVGWGKPPAESQWIDSEIAAAAEVHLRYTRDADYDATAVRAAFHRHFTAAEQDPAIKAVGISWESLCCTLVFDLEVAIKARRMHEIFGSDTKIIMVVRNPFSLLRSLYFEMVRDGFPGLFEDFLEYQYFYPFKSILRDLKFFDVYEVYAEAFGRDNIKVIPFESLKSDPAGFLDQMSHHLGVSTAPLKLRSLNASSDLKVLEATRLINQTVRHNMGNSYFSLTDTDKLVDYWRAEFGELPRNHQKNQDLRLVISLRAQQMARKGVADIDASYSDEWRLRLTRLWRQSCRHLQDTTGLDLATHGYPV